MTTTRIKHTSPVQLACLMLASCFILQSIGCASSSYADLDPKVVPPGFELTLGTYSTDGKRTYFELAADGELSFAGGKAAVIRNAQPVLTLSLSEHLEVWALVVNNNLLSTKNQMFKSPKKVAYDISIDAGKSFRSRSFHVTDDNIPPAAIQLHDRMFGWQADVRYKETLPAEAPKKP